MFYFLNVQVAPHVWAIVTDSMERRMPFETREAARQFAVKCGLQDYEINQSMYTKGYTGYQ